jgi:hypothetical protein
MLFPFNFLRSDIIDPDYLAFYNRVIAAGGSLTVTEQSATLQLVLDLKSYGIWANMKAIYPMVGASAAACAQNLKSSSFTGTFTSGWTFASTGATPNGTSAYMNTSFVPSSALSSQDSNHISFYSRTSGAASSQVEIGSVKTTAAASYFHQHIYYIGGFYFVFLSTITANDPAVANSLGFFNGTRNTSTTTNAFKNGTLLSAKLASALALNSLNIYVGAANIDGSASNFSSKQCAFASLGDGMTNTQATNYYTAVQAFQTTLSRQVV